MALYSDRHSIFSKHAPEDPKPTQFERAVKALGIEPILAMTPQAKGRVERAFQTLQDRLVKALRVAGVKTLKGANTYLKRFIRERNERFGKPPRLEADAHRAVGCDEQTLRLITCEQHERKLSKSLSSQYRDRQYLIQTEGRQDYHLRGATVTVCDDGDETPVVVLYRGKALPYRSFGRHEHLPRVVDEKTLDERVDRAVERALKPRWRPAADHPWRGALRERSAAFRGPDQAP